MQCGPFLISTYLLSLMTSGKHLPEASIGRTLSASPCMISVGTSIFLTSSLKSVNHDLTQASVPIGDALDATFQLYRTACLLMSLSSFSSNCRNPRRIDLKMKDDPLLYHS